MTDQCDFCQTTHEDFHWRIREVDGRLLHLCRKAYDPNESPASIRIGASKTEQRVNHWKDIKSRVTTHEGEFLSGKRGTEYVSKWGKQYLGVDAKPTNFNAPEYQRVLRGRK